MDFAAGRGQSKEKLCIVNNILHVHVVQLHRYYWTVLHNYNIHFICKVDMCTYIIIHKTVNTIG